ncbi:MAG: methyltransferase [Epsilonproteobacteria bacterium]|nr:methyltransferase [Campylobacterota bacterium]
MIKQNFSKCAKHYHTNNTIQRQIIAKYTHTMDGKVVLDLGCGDGSLYQMASLAGYVGIDFSEEMLALHPSNDVYLFDFDTEECWQFIQNTPFDMLVSFSSLQWSKDLSFVFQNIAALHKPYLVTLFSANTFKTIWQITSSKSPIYSIQDILRYAPADSKYEISHFRLYFDDKIKMFKYITQTGIKGTTNLTYTQVKRLLHDYPLNYLEFESITLSNMLHNANMS